MLKIPLNATPNSQLDAQLSSNLKVQPSLKLEAQLSSSLKVQPNLKLDAQLSSNLKGQPNSQLEAQLSSNQKVQPNLKLDAQLRSNLKVQPNLKLGSKLSAQLNAQLGSIGEKVAASLLRQKGYRILYCNWRQWRYELDLIAQDQDNTLVFVEVRTRAQEATALTSMTRKKCQSLLAAAQAFLQAKNLWSAPCRFDLVCVENQGKTLKPEHYINIDLTPAMASSSWQPW